MATAAQLHIGVGPLTPFEVSFLTENESITIALRQRLDELNLISVLSCLFPTTPSGNTGRATYPPSDRHNVPQSHYGLRSSSRNNSAATSSVPLALTGTTSRRSRCRKPITQTHSRWHCRGAGLRLPKYFSMLRRTTSRMLDWAENATSGYSFGDYGKCDRRRHVEISSSSRTRI